MARHLGIFSGTFNPIHDGHISFALAAAKKCKLEKVIFLPEPKPRFKKDIPNASKRLKQIREATMNFANIDVRLLNQDQFSVGSTLPELQKLFPDTDFTLLMGSDVALRLPSWPDVDRLLSVCNIAVGLRSTHTEAEVRQTLDKLGPATNYIIIKAAFADAASSQFK
jgi:nicotinate-nucleotide adenylyltransferase